MSISQVHPIDHVDMFECFYLRDQGSYIARKLSGFDICRLARAGENLQLKRICHHSWDDIDSSWVTTPGNMFWSDLLMSPIYNNHDFLLSLLDNDKLKFGWFAAVFDDGLLRELLT